MRPIPGPIFETADTAVFDALAAVLPDGMKLIAYGPGGVLENVTEIVGFEKLCLLLADEPDLVECIFEAVGETLVRYYEIAAAHPAVGACIDNDDWGFKTQTMLSPRQMRQYVFPWHKRIVEVCHRAGKPVILHSCGHFERILDDMAAIGIDARHSYEDTILPVEEAYERYRDRFAIIGGIDVDFVCRASPTRCMAAPGPCWSGPPAGAAMPWARATPCRTTCPTRLLCDDSRRWSLRLSCDEKRLPDRPSPERPAAIRWRPREPLTAKPTP